MSEMPEMAESTNLALVVYDAQAAAAALGAALVRAERDALRAERARCEPRRRQRKEERDALRAERDEARAALEAERAEHERELQELAEKLQALKCDGLAICTVCLVRPAQIAAVPCGHRFLCTSCDTGPDWRCYVCRMPMTGTL
jgi:hypothetical protein